MGFLVEVQMISFLTQVEGDQIYQAQAGQRLPVFALSLGISFWDSLLSMC